MTKPRGTSGPGITDVEVMLLAGQSNMSGRAEPAPTGILDRRVFQFGAHHREIEPATGVLDMHDTPRGLSYALLFARDYVAQLPKSSAVLLVPGAHGNTGFTTTSLEPPPPGYRTSEGTWQVSLTGPGISLYDRLLQQTAAAIIAAHEYFRATVTVRALLWHQGEIDALNGIGEAAYRSHLEALIHGVRAHVDDPGLPVLIGGMSPDWMQMTLESAPVHRAQLRVACTDPRASFVAGLPGTGRSGDVVHYGREGVEHLGSRTARALRVLIAATGETN